MTIDEHLEMIRAHARSMHDKLKKSPPRRMAEIRSMIFGILDRAMQIENEMMGAKRDGYKDDTEGSS